MSWIKTGYSGLAFPAHISQLTFWDQTTSESEGVEKGHILSKPLRVSLLGLLAKTAIAPQGGESDCLCDIALRQRFGEHNCTTLSSLRVHLFVTAASLRIK